MKAYLNGRIELRELSFGFRNIYSEGVDGYGILGANKNSEIKQASPVCVNDFATPAQEGVPKPGGPFLFDRSFLWVMAIRYTLSCGIARFDTCFSVG